MAVKAGEARVVAAMAVAAKGKEMGMAARVVAMAEAMAEAVKAEAMVVEADAVIKGQTASSSYKPAILDNGVRIMVPPHIGAGTRIVVDVYEQEYVRRAD